MSGCTDIYRGQLSGVSGMMHKCLPPWISYFQSILPTPICIYSARMSWGARHLSVSLHIL